jgi:sec-independent protein translocase protein TatC
MVFKAKPQPYSEDIFADSRMSFGEHIEDLRSHLLRAIYGFLIALVLGFIAAPYVLQFISRPVEIALGAYWDRYWKQHTQELQRRLADGDETLQRHNAPLDVTISLSIEDLKQAGLEPKGGTEQGFINVKAKLYNPVGLFIQGKVLEPLIGEKPTLSTLRAEEGFMAWVKAAVLTGFVLASPWVFYQLWSFVAAGLYPQEKRYVNVFMPFSIGLFLAGVLLCELAVLPKAVEALLWFNEWLGMKPELRFSEWLGFAILMPVIFGLTFQTPLVMLFAERVGFLTIDTMRKNRKIAWFVMAIFAAIITPSPDAFSMILLWLPMSLLYELGIFLCRMQPPRPTFDEEESDSGAMVEV